MRRLHDMLPLVLVFLTLPHVQAQEKDPPEFKLPALFAGKPLKIDGNEDELQRLLKERYNIALDDLQIAAALINKGNATPSILADPAKRFVPAALELATTSNEQIALLSQYVGLTRIVEREYEVRVAAGALAPASLNRAKYERLDAEILLLRTRRAAEKLKSK